MLTSYLSQIASSNLQDYIFEHEREDEKTLVLKKREVSGIPTSIIATQLSGRRKAKSKIPSWYKTKGILYAPTMNLEQCSSEATAIFKTQIINSYVSNNHVAADITGGFGVDAFFLSSLFKSVHYAEPNEELFEISKYNHHQLGAFNISHYCLSAEKFI